MKAIRYHEPEAMIAWALERIAGVHAFRSDAVAIGLERDGALCAVTVYDAFSPTNCFISIASDQSPAWMTREYIRHVFAYPFIQCGFPRVSCAISEHNAASLRFTNHFGWKCEGVMRCGGSEGEDIMLFGMLRHECRWIPKTLFPVTSQPARSAV